jgi:hypothetical protein
MRPPPSTPAELKEMVLLLTVNGPASKMPPPKEVPVTKLPEMVLLLTVALVG